MAGRAGTRERDWPTPEEITRLVRLLLRPAAGATEKHQAAMARAEAALERLAAVSSPGALPAAALEEAETRARAFFGVPHAWLTSSRSRGMEIAFKLSGLKPGDEVILPPTASLASVLYPLSIGARLVFAEPEPEEVARKVAPRTRVILVVHSGGVPTEIDPFLRIASQSNLSVIEEAEGGVGARHRGRYVGTIGHLGCLTLHEADGRRLLGGGALLLASAEIGTAEDGALYDRFGQLQIPGKAGATPAQAMGWLMDLKGPKSTIAARRKVAQTLGRRLSRERAILPPFEDSGSTTGSYSLYLVRIEPESAGGDIRLLLKKLTQRGFTQLRCSEPLYRSRLLLELGYDADEIALECRATEELLGRRLAYLDLGGMTGDQAELIATAVLDSVAEMRAGR